MDHGRRIRGGRTWSKAKKGGGGEKLGPALGFQNQHLELNDTKGWKKNTSRGQGIGRKI